MAASNDLHQKLVDHTFGRATYTPLNTVYVALYSSDPGVAGSANTNELTGTAYARVAVVNEDDEWGRTGNVISNLNPIDFPTPGSGGWGTATHWGIVSSASGAGDILFSAELDIPKTINEGDDPVRFAAGSLTIDRG